ncbi:hypothetical protein M9Y10_035034 [Tritrichomonas musculus]|uniref:Exonuclease 1 n=1 Tax=Tritrichomonas musculus TaxID=1915356 RepID=A0ABR2KHE8_9EUKA
MGVQNLLPLVSPISNKNIHISTFKGKKVAIDGYVWLHRLSYRNAKEIVENPGSSCIVPFLMNRIKHLTENGLIPVVVFDGQPLPQKASTSNKRHQDRVEAKEKAIMLETHGYPELALSYYQKAVMITSETVYTWIQELRKKNIEYIVAPYEADAELAYLCRTNYVDCVMTEDSDLLAYQTPHILFKYDDYSQTVTSVKFDDVLSHLQIDADQFIAICCLSGCDYMEHINRLGIQTSLKMIREIKDPIELIISLRNGGKYKVPEQYETQLKNAMLTFKAQKVYDPRTKSLKNLTPVEESPEFLGPDIAEEILSPLVKGLIDTHSHQRIAPPSPPPIPVSESQPVATKNKFSGQNKSKSQYFNSYKSSSFSSPASSKNKKPQKSYSTRSINSYFQLASPKSS